MICSNCSCSFEGKYSKYSDGRFCSRVCARGYATKSKRLEINQKVSVTLRSQNRKLTEEHKEKIRQRYKNFRSNKSIFCSCGKICRVGRKYCSPECKRKFGHAGGIRRFGGNHFKQGYHNGVYFDSSWELAYWLYCVDHNIPIERNEKGFEYYIDDKRHLYYPDFIVNGEYVEIKGWIRDKKTLEKIKQFPFKLKLVLGESDEMNTVLNFVTDRYGKDFYLLLIK